MNLTQPRGFIALASVLLLAAILTVSALGASTILYSIRLSLLDGEHYDESALQARSCMSIALSLFARDQKYAPKNESIALSDTQTCTVRDLATTSTTLTIQTSAQVKSAFSTLQRTFARGSGGLPVLP